jgi:hypothetical protein
MDLLIVDMEAVASDKMVKRTCPVCSKSVGSNADHRYCVLELFKTNKIKSVKEWEKMSIVRRRICVKVSETLKETPCVE